jgi:putative glutamine amidotransferase
LKLYSAIYNGHYPFDEMDGLPFSSFDVANDPDDLREKGALVVWGGGDISPSLYKKAVGKRTGADKQPGIRDRIEWALMHAAKERGMPIIGICRGAQMLCALVGGHLIQDVTDHGRSHPVTTSDGRTITVSSLHHQMMYPFDVEHTLLAWSKDKLSKHYLDVDTPVEVECEPECVWFPQVQGLAIQWHPEFMRKEEKANHYVRELIQQYLR